MADIAKKVILWYEENKRDLPWRNTRNPYQIWISEIILQQTRVVQGLEYYVRFMERFPDIKTLAEADEDSVMKYWQGLGYYSRARNLHAAAKDIVNRFGGEFPQSYKDVLSLKGIGEYTAAAICSFAWQQPYAVVDGNVYRVLSRIFGIDTPMDSGKGKKVFAGLAQELLDNKYPDTYNQGIMEFGALQCVPKSPDCIHCVLQEHCVAYAENRVEELPVKEGKTKVRARYFNYLHLRSEGKIVLFRRQGKDIWQGLYEYPLIETGVETDFLDLQKNEHYKKLIENTSEIVIKKMIEMPRHILSHQIIHARFYELELDCLPEGINDFIIIDENDEAQYAVSRLIELYREKRINIQH